MSVEITVEPAPTTPVITVNPAGEVTCTVTYSTLTGSINNPGGTNGSVQVKSGTGFAGIAPGTAGQVLTSTGTAWVSTTPATGGMVDPGSNGVVVRTALNTTTARSIAAGTNVSVTNGSGVSGNPTINVPDASTSVKGVVELATDGEVASGLAVQSNDARLSNARTPTAHASTHVTGGTDKIRDATASQDGLMTTAYASKLDAITGTNTGDVTIDATLADVATVTGQVLSADDLGSDKLWGWDESAGKVVGFTLGTNLTVSDTTINASGGGTPGGTNTQVQFNDGGSFGGDAGLTYDKTTDTLSATNLTVSGLSTLNHIHGSIAGSLYIHVKNTSGVTIPKGTPVYATGNVGSSDRIQVSAADYTNSAKMPAIGVLDATLADNGEGNAVIVGEITELATNSYANNQELFVGTAGLLGALPTTGEAQSIAVVSRVHASTGIIVVNAQARLNAALRALANNVGTALTALNASNITSGSLADAYIASAATWNAKQAAGNYITALTGDVTASGPGSVASTIANNAVTYAKIQDVSAASRLLGRGSASGAGDAQEITLGTNLSMSGTTLNATGGGGGIGGSTGSTDNAILRADGTGGSTLQSSPVTISDAGGISAPGGMEVETSTPTEWIANYAHSEMNFYKDNGAGVISSVVYSLSELSSSGTLTITNPNATGSREILLDGVADFTQLADTPASYTGQSGKVVAVKGTEDGLEFIAAGGGGTPGGSNTELQFNNSGAFGGADIRWVDPYLEMPIEGTSATRAKIGMQSGADNGAFTARAGDLLTYGGDAGLLPQSPGGGSGGLGGNIYTIGGDGFTSGDPGGDYSGGNAGNIETSGSNAADGSNGLDGGDIITKEGGGTINTLQGFIELGQVGSRTTIDSGATTDYTLVTPTAAGTAGQLLNVASVAGSVVQLGYLSTPIAIANGGTGQTTAVAAFDALAPTTTKGDLIVHNGTDNIRVAVGATNGHVLTVDSAEASGVKWAAGGGGGGTATWTLLSTTTVSGTPALVDVALSGTHRKYLVELDNFLSSAENTLQMRFSTDGGTTFEAGATDYQWGRSQIGIYNDSRGSSAQCNLNSITGKDAGEELAGEFTIYEPHNTSRRTWYSGRVWQQEWNAVQVQGNDVIGRRNALNDTTHIRLFFATGNITSGTIRVFGWNE